MQNIDKVLIEYIESLPEDLRTCYILHDLEGFAVAEIAKFVGCTEEAVVKRIEEARRMINLLCSQIGSERS